MEKHILCMMFLDVYNNISRLGNTKPEKIVIKDYDALENALKQYLIGILGYGIVNDCAKYFREIKTYLENIIYYGKNSNEKDIIRLVNNYALYFNNKINTHPFTKIFIEAISRLYDKDYDVKIDLEKEYKGNAKIAISNFNNTFKLNSFPRRGELDNPSVCINDIVKFEKILSDYISAIKESTSFYNVFSNREFDLLSEDIKVRMIFERTLFNATNYDLINIEQFFRKYTDFLQDKSFDKLKRLNYLGEAFDDEIYVMFKRSELDYETPYYLSFMLKNKRVELPNLRLGIETTEDKQIAHILATQTAQVILDLQNYDEIQNEVKDLLPKNSYFRFFNPTHLISIIISFGIFNGMGINEVQVADYLPFRYKKTVLDWQMSEEEANIFQMRLTNKNMFTYMRLLNLADGIDVLSYPELGLGLRLKLDKNISFNNPKLQQLYNYGYDLGKSLKYDDDYNKSKTK